MKTVAAVLSAFLVGLVLGGLGAYKGSQIAREVPKRDGSVPPTPRRPVYLKVEEDLPFHK